jgi:hypothetical protein
MRGDSVTRVKMSDHSARTGRMTANEFIRMWSLKGLRKFRKAANVVGFGTDK